jgi:hypothetical protein
MTELLESWHDGPARRAIEDFVARVTKDYAWLGDRCSWRAIRTGRSST